MPRPSVPAQVPSPPPAISRPPEPSRASPPRPEPLGDERFKIQFTASRETHDKLRELQALLRHQIPDGDLSQVFEKAIGLLLADVKQKKFAVRIISTKANASTADGTWSATVRRTTQLPPGAVEAGSFPTALSFRSGFGRWLEGRPEADAP